MVYAPQPATFFKFPSTEGCMYDQSALMISSYLPRSCGIATYAHDVVNGIIATGLECKVLAIDEGPALRVPSAEIWRSIRYDDRAAYAQAAHDIDAEGFSTVALQHEFGIFGGPDGEWVLELYHALKTPIFTTLHTVPHSPSENQRRIILEICAASRNIIVLSEISQRLLMHTYGIRENVIVIPHGVPDVPFTDTKDAKRLGKFAFGDRKVISTFGLIGRGKGIEHALDALRIVKESIPNVLYVIAGRTHPKVLEGEGESYRDELRARIQLYDLGKNVMFIDEFMSLSDVLGLLAATDVYFTPYIHRDQVVSGTLAYAMGAGKAILSTPYLYAQELLGDERGFLCDFGDANGMAKQLTMLLSDDVLRSRVERQAYRYGRDMAWPNVSKRLAAIYSDIECSDTFAPALQS